MRTHVLRCATILIAGIASLTAAERIDLNGHWSFRLDPHREGAPQGWAKSLPSGVETVSVPHTWNVGSHEDYEGTAWYFRTLTLPPGAVGRHVEIHFGATFYRAKLYVDGVEAASHEGGHTAWHADLTRLVTARNFLAVEVDNRPGVATIPGLAMDMAGGGNVWYDWWHYGGLVRDVWLTVNEGGLIRRQRIRSKLAGTSADITDEVDVENVSAGRLKARLRVELRGPGGDTVASAEKSLDTTEGRAHVPVSFHADGLRLWNLDQPNVYSVEARLVTESGAELDTLTDNYGFRTVELRERHLYLNGERVRLTGITRHEESPWEGLAETRGTMLRDWSEMKELGVTLTRPVHYPQHPFILDFCDRNGVLLIPEIPIWHFSEKQLQDPRVIQLAKSMETELVEQTWNHPSIFAWSVCNESATDTPGGIAYFRTMYDLLKELDPDRSVSYADDHLIRGSDPTRSSAAYADFIMMNEYAGTWHGDPENLRPALERVARHFPGKMVIISEFGAAGIFAQDNTKADRLRSRIIRDHLAIFRRYDFIGGAILWCYQDYRSHRNLRPGERSGLVEMGIVDENRQRYPSFFVWKEENSPASVNLRFRFTGKQRAPVGFEVRAARKDAQWLPTYELRGYRAVWEVRNEVNALVAGGEKPLGDMGAAAEFDVPLDVAGAGELHVRLRLMRPAGFTAAEKTLDWSAGKDGGDTIPDMRKRGIEVP